MHENSCIPKVRKQEPTLSLSLLMFDAGAGEHDIDVHKRVLIKKQKVLKHVNVQKSFSSVV